MERGAHKRVFGEGDTRRKVRGAHRRVGERPTYVWEEDPQLCGRRGPQTYGSKAHGRVERRPTDVCEKGPTDVSVEEMTPDGRLEGPTHVLEEGPTDVFEERPMDVGTMCRQQQVPSHCRGVE